MNALRARVARVQAFGGPEVLALDVIEVPPPGLREVRVRTAAIGLNRVEALYRAGLFGPADLPARIGYEAAGVVEAVGAGVEAVAVGERVATIPGLDMGRYGTNAEAFLYPADMLVAVPQDQPLDEAAATWMAFLTAYHLAEGGLVAAGRPALVTAASSAVGLAALQVVRREGGVPVALTRTGAKAGELRSAGAAHVIATDSEDVAARLAEIAGTAGAACAFDAVGGSMLERLAEALAPGGTLSVYGALDPGAAVLPLFPMMRKGLRLIGFSADQVTLDAAHRARAIAYIRSGLQEGAFRPVIARRFPLEDIAAAHRYLESNAQVGKVVICVQGAAS